MISEAVELLRGLFFYDEEFDGYAYAPPASSTEQSDEEDPNDRSSFSRKPKCVKCGDPNFSLDKNICIACRIQAT